MTITAVFNSFAEINTFFNTPKYQATVIDNHYEKIERKLKRKSFTRMVTLYKPLVSFTDKKGIIHNKLTDITFQHPPKNKTKIKIAYLENDEFATIYNPTKWFSLAFVFGLAFFGSLIIIGGISFVFRIESVTGIALIIGVSTFIPTVVMFLWLAFGSVVYNGVIGYQELNAGFWAIVFFWLILSLVILGIFKMAFELLFKKSKKKKKKKKKKLKTEVQSFNL